MSEKFSVCAGTAGNTIRLITLTPERDKYGGKKQFLLEVGLK